MKNINAFTRMLWIELNVKSQFRYELVIILPRM